MIRRQTYRTVILMTTPSAHWLISGASGFIGQHLCAQLAQLGVKVTALSRSPSQTAKRLNIRAIAATKELDAQERFDVIVHLAGANVFAWPWTEARKSVLMQSRLDVADDLLAFCARAKHPPSTWIQASAVGFYPTTSTRPLHEQDSPGEGFAATLCQAIEARALEAQQWGLRVVLLRLGLVLGKSGGVFPMQRLGTQLGGGAVLGDGTQRMSWIHVSDAVGIMLQAADKSHVSGPVNAIAPDCPSNRDWTMRLARRLKRPVIWRVPAFLLRPVLGQRAPLLLQGAPIDIQAQRTFGLSVRFPTLESALDDLCGL
jgi:uncharacterized protein